MAYKLEELVLDVDTEIIAPYTKSLGISQGHFYSPLDDDQQECDLIENTISVYNDSAFFKQCKFHLYVGEELIKEWNRLAVFFGDTINSPYNYDSWELVKYDNVVKGEGWIFIHRELVFTITNDDLN
mgnify:CR=1 FL=1